MGLLDRFRKAPGPDALTWEAVARARVVPGVTGAVAVDADTVEVTWRDHPGTTTLSLADVRERWTRASGFDRIELMDEVVAGLAPPPPGSPATDPLPAAGSSGPGDTVHAGATGPGGATGSWAEARASIGVVVVAAGAGPGAEVRWNVAVGGDAVATVAGRPVGAEDLGRWGVDAGDVRAAALDRLAVAGPALDPIGPDARAWVPTSSVAPAPAWLAVPSVLLAAAGLDQAIALAPLPTELVVVDPDEPELLASVLSSTAAIVEGGGELLLPAPLLVAADGCRPWLPGPEHPCAALVDRLRAAG